MIEELKKAIAKIRLAKDDEEYVGNVYLDFKESLTQVQRERIERLYNHTNDVGTTLRLALNYETEIRDIKFKVKEFFVTHAQELLDEDREITITIKDPNRFEGNSFRIYVALGSMTVGTTSILGSTDLTDEELKFFDKLGFDLFPLHKIKTGQKIRDWFFNKEM